ncbi:MAG: hypothetical protein MJZ93_03990 [Paludibacteraceae bacterium]|nr:hypothetical protein [Paludibacteraceae bacterium]
MADEIGQLFNENLSMFRIAEFFKLIDEEVFRVIDSHVRKQSWWRKNISMVTLTGICAITLRTNN